MSEYINRDDALNCFHDWVDEHGDVFCADDIAEYIEIESLPSIELVRCKDCKYLSRITSQVKVGEWFGCLNDKGLACCVKLDDYCSYGERGEADDNTGSD